MVQYYLSHFNETLILKIRTILEIRHYKENKKPYFELIFAFAFKKNPMAIHMFVIKI